MKTLFAALITIGIVGVLPAREQPPIPFKLPPLPKAAEPQFSEFKVQRQWEKGNDFYADVLNHNVNPPRKFNDRDTDAHENTHLIDNDITNDFNVKDKFKTHSTGFYVGKNRAVIVEIPKFKLLDIGPFVPKSLRGNRYNLYLVQQPTQQPILNNDPLYIWTEWNGYVNGTTVSVEDAEAGVKANGSDTVFANVEFLVYSLAVAMACEKHDPAYYKANAQFKNFLVWQAKRSMDVYRRGYKFKHFQWNLDYIKELETGADGKPFRDLMTNLGLDLKADVFGND